jgi:phosphatidylglycerol:prolipoprotein diacylglycerol transferase
MQQILFHVPFTEGLVPPDGVALAGFGAMMFLTFVLTTMVWGARRCPQVGLTRDRVQDLAMVFFLCGFGGARVVYMMQYRDQFPDRTPLGLATAFVRIDKGGIVLYGGLIGGFLGYLLFRQFVLKRLGVNGWKLADAVAPLLALGIAVGRLGCYLNGCCWGQPVCEECQAVPLSGELGRFPLLPAHAREQVCAIPRPSDRLPGIHGLQTSTGFTLTPVGRFGEGDPVSVVAAVEPGSAAEAAGLKAGDRVVEVNGEPNRIVVELSGRPEAVDAAVKRVKGAIALPGWTADDIRLGFDTAEAYHLAAAETVLLRGQGVTASAQDRLWEEVRDWREGRKGVNKLSLVVDRGGQTIPLTFTPRTVPFYPTQLYEVVSMTLLIALLLAFQPFRRHDGQVMVVAMLGYAVHRFFNEAIRIEPVYEIGLPVRLTLSQWISIGIFAAGVLIEVYLRLSQPKLPAGELPLSYGVVHPKNEAGRG